MNHLLLSFNPVLGDKLTLLSIVNWGTEENGLIVYENKHGEQRSTREELAKMNVTICQIHQVDIRSSLHNWYRKNWNQWNKEITIDESVTTGEVYRGNCWHIGLMIDTASEKLRVRPIF